MGYAYYFDAQYGLEIMDDFEFYYQYILRYTDYLADYGNNYESTGDSSHEPIQGQGGFVYYGTESGETSDELGNETYVSNEEYRGIGAYLLGDDHSWLSEYVDMARESDEFSNDWGRNVGAEALDKSAFIVTLTTLLNVLQF